MSANPRDPDLTARARLRLAALRLFADNGFDATSTRAIAAEAGVSHALLRHHFVSKDGLRAAVDDDVLNTFDEGLARLGPLTTSEQELSALGAMTAQLFGSDNLRRNYLRRALLEGGPAGNELFRRLLDGTHQQLQALQTSTATAPTEPSPADAADLRWAPYQVLFLILGPMLLEPLIAATLDAPVFDPVQLAERSASNQRFIARGLLASADQWPISSMNDNDNHYSR